MKKFSAIIFLFISQWVISQPLYKNIPMLSNWDNDSLPVFAHGAYNDIWGYTSDFGSEMAIIGTIGGTYFIDVTDPANPQQIAFFAGRDTIGTNRDFKTYGHYAYGVCDQGNSSLQIFDLNGSVTKVYDSQSLTKTCHTIFIENDRLYLCGSRDSAGAPRTLVVASLADPANPQWISTLSTPMFDYVHACTVKNDTAYLSCGGSGLFIYDYTDPLAPQILQTFTSYPQQGYNHSNWITDDGKTLIFADETHGSGLKVYDISNLENPILKSIIRSNLLGVSDSLGAGGSIPHNPYIVGDKAVISYYHDGVQVFDISDPAHPFMEGYFDTEPLNTNYDGYNGCWGVYPFLPSKNIIASDLHNGLFVLAGNIVLGKKENPSPGDYSPALAFPNPASAEFYFNANLKTPGTLICTVSEIAGKTVFSTRENLPSGNSLIRTDCSRLASGTYFINAAGGDFNFSGKIILIR